MNVRKSITLFSDYEERMIHELELVFKKTQFPSKEVRYALASRYKKTPIQISVSSPVNPFELNPPKLLITNGL